MTPKNIKSGQEKQCRVLVVEDNRDLAHIVAMHLSDLNMKVDKSYNGKDGFQLACKNQYDLILLDIMMPKIDGYEVCRQIRANKELQGVKIIMVSARAMEDERLKGIEVGADEYITKPFDEDVLLEMVKSHLD